ncbi:GNAT family N-acetyltransferase [Sporomusa sp.]|uniref:GNAT family N-acetyltransferase n=1 Tax=Sporomusa sp. TaxID=2078658 RepID=UPI002CFA4381|nr:GNAT family N-acetyltransferase [Sporomusa sp.]HWR44678.1 GNAT family N-acetyltransferase [Sporomusa sp.]
MRGWGMMSLDVTIRHAEMTDIESMLELLKALFAIETDFAVDSSKQRCGLELMLQEDPNRCVLVAEADQTVIGMCTAQLLISTAEGGLKAIIEDVVVKDAYRSRGIGIRLLKAVSQWAGSQGAKRLDLLADQHNRPAVNFYQKLGWSQTELVCLQKRL